MAESAWLASLVEDMTFVRRRLLVAVRALGPEDLDGTPAPTLMTPRQQIVHVAQAELHWRSRITGEAVAWPADPPAAGLDLPGLEALLTDQRQRTLSLVAELTEADLVRPVTDAHGRELNVVWVLNHLIRHDAHHAGQILCLWRIRHPQEPVDSRYDRVLSLLDQESAPQP